MSLLQYVTSFILFVRVIIHSGREVMICQLCIQAVICYDPNQDQWWHGTEEPRDKHAPRDEKHAARKSPTFTRE